MAITGGEKLRLVWSSVAALFWTNGAAFGASSQITAYSTGLPETCAFPRRSAPWTDATRRHTRAKMHPGRMDRVSAEADRCSRLSAFDSKGSGGGCNAKSHR